jgi:hypothetical protein
VILDIHIKLDASKEGARFDSIGIQNFIERASENEESSCSGVSGVITNLMNKDQEIQNIVNQLEGLQIQHSDLLQPLG